MWRLSLILVFILSIFPVAVVTAQGSNTYENADLGIAFDMQDGWIVTVQGLRLTIGVSSDLTRLESSLPPENLLVTIRLASYNELALQSVEQLPQRILENLVLPGATAAEPVAVTYGNVTGYETEYTDSGLTSRVAILLSADGRAAIIRGMAPEASWSNTSIQLSQFLQTLRFTIPQSMANPLDSIADEDGGVLWHYQMGQIHPENQVTLGGMVYDQFGVLYVAAGKRGILALDQNTGEFKSFLGPIFGTDNYVDVGLSPDAKLFIANATTHDSRRVMVIDRVGNLQTAWGNAGDEPGQFAEGMPRTIAVTAKGDVWTISEGHSAPPTNRLYRFGQDGNLIEMIDFNSLHADLHNAHLEVDLAADRIYIVGEMGGLNVVSWNGEVIASGVGVDFLTEVIPTDLAIGSTGSIVISTVQQGFLLMNTAGVVIDRFGYLYDSERGGAFLAGEYFHPNGLAVESDGTVYFAETHPDTGFAQVQAMTFIGEGNLILAQRTPAVADVQIANATLSSGGDIAYGDTVYGILTNQSNQHDYIFRVESGDKVVIVMRDVSVNQSLDTRLILLDGNYNQVATNDDVGDNPDRLKPTDSVIRITLSSPGRYVIRATRFGGSGHYELKLSKDG